MVGGRILYQGSWYPLLHAFGSSAASADGEVVAAGANETHRMVRFIGSGAGTATFKSNTTAISHSLDSLALALGLPINEHGYFETESGEALNVNPDGGTLYWSVWYITIESE